MGRRIRWAYYYFKRFLMLAIAAWGVVYVISYLSLHYSTEVEARGQNIILPQIQEVNAKGIERYLKEPGATTLIFIYSSRSILSRWYFDDFNKMAAKYGGQGVRILYISVDDDVKDLADFMGSQGDLYFTPFHMDRPDSELFPDMIGGLGGDPFGGALPYMGIMNASRQLRDFSQAIIRTGKIQEVLEQTLRGG